MFADNRVLKKKKKRANRLAAHISTGAAYLWSHRVLRVVARAYPEVDSELSAFAQFDRGKAHRAPVDAVSVPRRYVALIFNI